MKEKNGRRTHAEDDERVREDGADHRGLNNVELALDEGENRDEKLDSVTERRVEQTAKRVADTKGELLRGEAEQ